MIQTGKTCIAILGMAASFQAGGFDLGNLVIENELAACVSIAPIAKTESGNLLILKAKWQSAKPIGECGCFSALATYTSTVENHGTRQILQEGLIAFTGEAEKSFVLSSEPRLIESRKIHLRITCAPPE